MLRLKGKTVWLIANGMLVAAQTGTAASLSQGFTYQGRFFTPDGLSPMTDTVDITLGVYSPGTCLLYEEKHVAINLAPTKGFFSIRVGSALGDPKRTARDPSLTLAKLFANDVTAALRADDSATTNTCA